MRLVLISIIVALAFVLLTGCVTKDVPVLAKPRLETYSDAFLKRALDETLSLPPPCTVNVISQDCSALHLLMLDYLALRDKIRGNAL